MNKKTTKTPKLRHAKFKEYDFLQYIRIVFRWATENYKIPKAQIELLLYLYPKEIFTRKDFSDFHMLIGMYQHHTLKRMIDNGTIIVWRKAVKKEKALYTLSPKIKLMCSKMHKYCTGELEMSIVPETNAVAKNEKGLRMNNYYLDLMKIANKDRD